MRTDVAVIGTGPAGGQAARLLASEGVRVTLLDMRDRVGDPVQCGEAISQVALQENDLTPADWVMSRVEGVAAHVPIAGAASLPAPGYCIDRAAFDRALVAASTSDGARLITRCHVSQVQPNGSKVRLHSSKGEIEADYVIAADGPRSPTAQSLGLVEGSRWNLGMQYKFPADAVDVDRNWLHLFLEERYMGGYAWIFPRGPEVSIGVDVAAQPRAHLEAFCESWDIRPEDRQETNGGRIPTRVRLRQLGSGNVLIAGDAAGATNPIFGGGIHAALSTGRMAAEAILGSWENGKRDAVARYEDQVRRSPFFRPVLAAVADLLAETTDEELALAVKVYRRRHRWRGLLRLVPAIVCRPFLVRRTVRLPWLREALEVTAQYGW